VVIAGNGPHSNFWAVVGAGLGLFFRPTDLAWCFGFPPPLRGPKLEDCESASTEKLSSGPDGKLNDIGIGGGVGKSRIPAEKGVEGAAGSRNDGKVMGGGVPGATEGRDALGATASAFFVVVTSIGADDVVSNGSLRADSNARLSLKADRSALSAAAAIAATDASLTTRGRLASIGAGLSSRAMDGSRRFSRPTRRLSDVMSSRSRTIAASMLFIVRLTISKDDALEGTISHPIRVTEEMQCNLT
jgi:hypothetical protein